VADLRLVGLTKLYGTTVAVDHVDLDVRDREFVTLLGPSGSGKTTVLRLIAGYLQPNSGAVLVGSRPVQHLPPERRDIGMVFQSYALFPHMTVFGNVAFGLARRGVAGDVLRRRVADAVELVRLRGFEQRYPRELSGGQQQRVALARALVIQPTLLLLDEPLSNLDAKLRGDMRLEIRRLQRELGITTLLVTHDQEEALTVSDRVAVLHRGRIEQLATPDELYRRPVNRFVADFVGKMNTFAATRMERRGDLAVYRIRGGHLLTAPAGPESVLVAVRPEAIGVGGAPGGVDVNALTGRVRYRAFLGELVEIGVVLAGGAEVVVRSLEPAAAAAEPDRDVQLWWPVERTGVLETGE
jgi:putative spermidine/putrescine transport system ATP-binding protein